MLFQGRAPGKRAVPQGRAPGGAPLTGNPGVRFSQLCPGVQNPANNRDDSDVWKTSDGRRVNEKNVARTAKPLFPKNITERGDTSKFGNVRRAPEYLYSDFFGKCCWFLFTSVLISLVWRVIKIYGWIT